MAPRAARKIAEEPGCAITHGPDIRLSDSYGQPNEEIIEIKLKAIDFNIISFAYHHRKCKRG